jgi:preprotein translocase subunit SecG
MLIAEITENGGESDSFYRFMGVVAVLWVLGTLLLPILRRERRPSPARDGVQHADEGSSKPPPG